MSLTQDMLTGATRNKAYVDIMVYVRDESVVTTSVTSNDLSAYSNISNITDVDSYTSVAIATLEENLWLLNGSLITPYSGQTYNGYMSDSISDEDGNFDTNPYIQLNLKGSNDVEYFSAILNPAVTSGYPREVQFDFYNGSTSLYSETVTVDEVTTLPTISINPDISNCTKVIVTFIGTQYGNRRIRVSNLMFGKMIVFTTSDILNCDYDDVCSFVPDSIPSRTFSWEVENYDKRYNIDNPSSELPILDEFSDVSFRWGYETDDGNIEYDDWKHLKLISVDTDADDTVTFEAGSLLDLMEDTYDHDVYEGERTVETVVNRILNFYGFSSSLVNFDGNFDDVIVDTPLSGLSCREIIQLAAFGCGATLLILDSGGLSFSNLSLSSHSSSGTFDYSQFTSIPKATQLDYTTDITVTSTSSSIATSIDNVGSSTCTQYSVDLSYSPCYGASATCSGGTITSAKYYVDHCELVLNFTGDSCEVTITGYPITTTTTQSKLSTSSTLVLDSQMVKNPTATTGSDGTILERYALWYGKRFKYTMDTRGEPLVDAGTFIEIQTPFSETEGSSVLTTLDCYVLENHISFDGGWSGDMEVIAL